MNVINSRDRAVLRGLRAAAQVAAVGLTVAGAISIARVVHAADPAVPSQASAGGQGVDAEAALAGVEERFRVRDLKGNCGCSACWGPPAPPVVSERDLTKWLEELQS
jgi:hypothetical protein